MNLEKKNVLRQILLQATVLTYMRTTMAEGTKFNVYQEPACTAIIHVMRKKRMRV